MSLKEELLQDMKTAMKAKEAGKTALSVIRMVRNSIRNTEINGKCELDDAGVAAVIAKEMKQRKESLAEFEKAGRSDLAADHSGWRAFDAAIWKKNTNTESGMVCSCSGRRIYDAGASSEADGGEDCALYAGANTGGGIFLSPGEP